MNLTVSQIRAVKGVHRTHYPHSTKRIYEMRQLGLSYKYIASVVGITPPSVAGRYERYCRFLRLYPELARNQ